MKEVPVVILAGGFGKRLGNLTQENQKCVLNINGFPILIHIINNLLTAFGSLDLKLAVGYKQEQVKKIINYYFGNNSKTKLTYIPHNPGTEGWGIYYQLKESLTGFFLGMPGDIITHHENYLELANLAEQLRIPTLSLSPNIKEAETHGIGVVNSYYVTKLFWPPINPVPESFNRDMTIFASFPDDFKRLLEDFPNPGKSIGFSFMDSVNSKRDIGGYIWSGKWIHIASTEDLKKMPP